MVAETYRDLEQASGRLILIDRLAVLLAGTPQELLPTVFICVRGWGRWNLPAVDLGLAKRLALRAWPAARGRIHRR